VKHAEDHDMSKQLCVALALVAATGLSACGGGGGDDGGGNGNGNGGNGNGSGQGSGDPLAAVAPEASQSSSGLVAYLKALVSTKAEDREPVSLGGAAPPPDDASEPAPLS
jgi:hypothetical protein